MAIAIPVEHQPQQPSVITADMLDCEKKNVTVKAIGESMPRSHVLFVAQTAQTEEGFGRPFVFIDER